ncbi:hypothetical protein HPB51_019485 [Rhipicephalus microplus]|uniref:Uncharacterized protein n=1 Tax=Rhipicephalus microplus TaxID=6941 RepID=A0A9J6DBJ1_RHIMP|nr:hypothetical protein HPB51_019485 [Rhipicephalus microplus]
MPHLPTNDYKVVVHPRGGFNVSDYKTNRIYCCLGNAAEIDCKAAEEDSICLNYKQNIVPRRKSKTRSAAGPGITGFADYSNSSQRGTGSHWQWQQQQQRYNSNIQEVSWADLAASPGASAAAGFRDRVAVSGGGGPVPGRMSSGELERAIRHRLGSLEYTINQLRHENTLLREEIAKWKGGVAQQQKRQVILEQQPLPPHPVLVEVETVDESSVETANEREDSPVCSKRTALDPERPTTESCNASYERLKECVRNIETSLDECFVSQMEQINKMFTMVNNSVAKLAEQMTQGIATLAARIDEIEAKPSTSCGQADAGDR